MTKKVTSRSTKSEILDAFKELETAYKELESKKSAYSPSNTSRNTNPQSIQKGNYCTT